MARTGVLASVACLLVCQQATPIDKDGLLSKYRDKVVVVVKDGLWTGMCGQTDASLTVVINDLESASLWHEQVCQAEPMHKGEVLKVTYVSFHSDYLIINLSNLSPHSATRGVGAFAHEIVEMGRVGLRIHAVGKDFDRADALATQWLKPFDTAAEAASFGNTSSGVFVKQVKAGMSFAEVETALGLPQTRCALHPNPLAPARSRRDWPGPS